MAESPFFSGRIKRPRDIQYNGINKPNQPFILDLVTLEYFIFQNIPNELVIIPDANWAAVQAPGRNVSDYQYISGEDTIQFTLSYYSNQDSRKDVLLRCKWIESLTRNDGWDNPPHPILFSFGKLFTQSKFIVSSAPYKINLFDREYDMLPRLATQDITLKRIHTGNPTHNELTQYDY